jgi:CheY-like chemotaxis protein
MKVLLIEDEEHKANDLVSRLLANGISREDLVLVSGVRQAVLNVTQEHYDLIVVDMALPTFSNGVEDSSGGAAQAVGGLEVLRALSAAGASAKIIIVTQYPEIILGGNKLKLHQAARVLSSKYKQEVLGAVLYSYKTAEWGAAFDSLLGKAQ